MGLDVSSETRLTKVVSLSLKIATIYFIIGVLWILLSDEILGLLVSDPTVLTNLAIIKGWFYVSVTALMLFVLISRGASQIEQSEKEARLSDAKYRELVESANSIIMRRDITGHVTFFNEFAQNFFGYSKEEILGRNVIGTIAPEVDRSGRDLKEMIEDIGRHPERYTKNENENMRANGERVWLAWTNKPIRDENGQIKEILCIGNDISERKITEEKLQNFNTFLDTIIEIAPHAMWISDDNGILIRSNHAMRDLFKITDDDVVGKYNLLQDNILEEQGYMPLVKEVFGKGRTVKFTIDYDSSLLTQLNFAQTVFVILDVTISPVLDTDGRVTNAIIQEVDITERKRAENELLESENKFKSFAEQALVGIYILQDGVFKYVNAKFAQMFGYTVGECLNNMTFKNLVHPEDLTKVEEQVRRRTSGEVEFVQYTFRGLKKDGQIFPVEVYGATSVHKGEPAGTGTILDISERKRAEEALRENEARLKIAMDLAKLVQWEYDVKTGMYGFDDQFYALYGTSSRHEGGPLMSAEAYARKFIPPEESNVVAEAIAKTLATTDPNFTDQLEHRIIRADGEERHIIVRWGVVCDQKGKVVEIRGANQDVTERKRAEERLREYEKVVEGLEEMIAVVDQDYRYVIANRAFLNYRNQQRDQVIGRLVGDSSRNEVFERVIKEKLDECFLNKVVKYEMKYALPKFGETDLFITYLPIEGPSGVDRVACVFQDVTERKREEEKRKKLEEQLFQAQKMESVGRLAGGVAHDFNNMLGVIIGRAEMALEQVEKTDPHYENLQEILKAGLRSADLTRQLLAFARKQTAIPKILDLNDTISGMLKMLRRLIGEDIDLSWQPELDLWKVKIDPSQVDQILANLVVNARDAISGAGAITMRTENVVIDDSNRAETPEFIPGEYVLLAVSDNGDGMSKEVCQNIFEPFFTTKELGKGTGLGLSTVHGIVKQNDGFIYVASDLGKGTTVKIYLPRLQDKTAQVPSKEAADKPRTGTETILLVEDDEAILNLSKMILERFGYTVIAAHTPVHAIHLVEDHPGDLHLLITDVVMPGMNGRELAEKIAAIRPNFKCLYMSGYTADVIGRQGILEEGVNFIQKPFGSADLAAKVRQVLDHLE